ncbi:PFA3 [Symbiodinium sp. CCMP2592]|nr:PFA3 [Symbiodinium sp. CCMP2592]
MGRRKSALILLKPVDDSRLQTDISMQLMSCNQSEQTEERLDAHHIVRNDGQGGLPFVEQMIADATLTRMGHVLDFFAVMQCAGHLDNGVRTLAEPERQKWVSLLVKAIESLRGHESHQETLTLIADFKLLGRADDKPSWTYADAEAEQRLKALRPRANGKAGRSNGLPALDCGKTLRAGSSLVRTVCRSVALLSAGMHPSETGWPPQQMPTCADSKHGITVMTTQNEGLDHKVRRGPTCRQRASSMLVVQGHRWLPVASSKDALGFIFHNTRRAGLHAGHAGEPCFDDLCVNEAREGDEGPQPQECVAPDDLEPDDGGRVDLPSACPDSTVVPVAVVAPLIALQVGLAAVTVLLMGYCSLADPGQLKKTRNILLDGIDLEQGDRPLRAHKSWQYRGKIRRYDHYCKWVNNVIGLLNHREFVLMLIGLCLIGLLGVALDGYLALLLATKGLWEAEVAVVLHLAFSVVLLAIEVPIFQIHVGLVSRIVAGQLFSDKAKANQTSMGDGVPVEELDDEEYNQLFDEKAFVYDKTRLVQQLLQFLVLAALAGCQWLRKRAMSKLMFASFAVMDSAASVSTQFHQSEELSLGFDQCGPAKRQLSRLASHLDIGQYFLRNGQLQRSSAFAGAMARAAAARGGGVQALHNAARPKEKDEACVEPMQATKAIAGVAVATLADEASTRRKSALILLKPVDDSGLPFVEQMIADATLTRMGHLDNVVRTLAKPERQKWVSLLVKAIESLRGHESHQETLTLIADFKLLGRADDKPSWTYADAEAEQRLKALRPRANGKAGRSNGLAAAADANVPGSQSQTGANLPPTMLLASSSTTQEEQDSTQATQESEPCFDDLCVNEAREGDEGPQPQECVAPDDLEPDDGGRVDLPSACPDSTVVPVAVMAPLIALQVGLAAVTVLLMGYCSLADPGQLKKTRNILLDGIDLEQGDRPLRAHKSWQYRGKIRRYDHYCKWVNNVIGLLNHREFVLMLIGLCLIGLLGVALDGYLALLLATKGLWEAEVAVVLHLAFSVVLLAIEVPIFQIHVGLVSRIVAGQLFSDKAKANQTSMGDGVPVEELDDEEYNQLFDEKAFVYDKTRNRWDKGWSNNCCNFWCWPRWPAGELGEF